MDAGAAFGVASRPMNSRRARSAIAIAAALATGCSLVAVKRPPAQIEAGDDPECTDTWSPPALDAVVAVLSGVLSVNLFIAAANRDDGSSGMRTGAVATAAIGGAFLASTAYGVVFVNRCRDAKRSAGAYETPVPRWDERPPGTHGGRCRDDDSCDGDLICELPMRTCIPIDDTGEDL